jgi:hypothetical protein
VCVCMHVFVFVCMRVCGGEKGGGESRRLPKGSANGQAQAMELRSHNARSLDTLQPSNRVCAKP